MIGAEDYTICPSCGMRYHMSHYGWMAHGAACQPITDRYAKAAEASTEYHDSEDEGTIYREETPYTDRSPREQWESAWRESRELHRG